ncbi:hypothetical protein ACI2I3_00725 [Psychrobacter namhaensis]|uniref:Uncharacterized protein n=1 Tax=Psychrobacter namhaensis TaxID=292734 RepID=A0ABW8L537_9GAMM
MTDFYERMADTALRLITDKGVSCVITSLPQNGGFDPATGMPLDDVAGSEQSGQCVVLNYSKVVTNMPESLVQQGDKKILIAAKGVDMPSIGSTIAVLDKNYTVVEVKDIKPADVALIYEVHGRE